MATTVNYVKFIPLTLRKTLNDNKSEAVLQFMVRAGYPRITVITDTSKHIDPETNKINYNYVATLTFDYVNMFNLIEGFKTVMSKTEDSSFSVCSYNNVFKDGKRTDDIELRGKVTIKKTSGVMSINIEEKNKDAVTFKVLPSTKWFKYLDSNSNPITSEATLSSMHAKSYYTRLLSAYTEQYKKDFSITSEVEITE